MIAIETEFTGHMTVHCILHRIDSTAPIISCSYSSIVDVSINLKQQLIYYVKIRWTKNIDNELTNYDENYNLRSAKLIMRHNFLLRNTLFLHEENSCAINIELHCTQIDRSYVRESRTHCTNQIANIYILTQLLNMRNKYSRHKATPLHVAGFLSSRVTSCATSDSRESSNSQEKRTGESIRQRVSIAGLSLPIYYN